MLFFKVATYGVYPVKYSVDSSKEDETCRTIALPIFH